MASSDSAPTKTSPLGGSRILHYYTGKLRAFWKDKIFFSDQRNVAVVSITSLYLDGEQATESCLPKLEAMVKESGWQDAPEIHGYVTPYESREPPSWPYQLSGKMLWYTKFAWQGCMPEFIRKKWQYDMVYYPISYYTGKVIKIFKDKILFGDVRNNVMVNMENFYLHGERGTKSSAYAIDANTNPVIHCYVTKLEVLTDIRNTGPEPHLPTWPKQYYASDTWVAKFAWQGEMPEVVKKQVGRYHIIRMNQWDILDNLPFLSDQKMNTSYNLDRHRTDNSSPSSDHYEEVILSPSFVPCEQEPGIMKGTLLMVNHSLGLMTSFSDVIAFTKEEFYINGEKFRSHLSMSDFFQDRRIPLTAYVIRIPKKEIFHINVVWRAVCVVLGNQGKDIDILRRPCTDGKLPGKLVETGIADQTSDRSFTHFTGELINLSYSSGVIKYMINPKQSIKIFFKRKSLYMYGYKYNSSCSFLDIRDTLESYTWSV